MAKLYTIEDALKYDESHMDLPRVLTRGDRMSPMILESTQGRDKEPMFCLIPFMGPIDGLIALYPSIPELLQDHPDWQFYEFDNLSDIVRWL